MPVGDAKVADCVLGKTVEALTERFVVDLLPEREQPLPRVGFVIVRVITSCQAPGALSIPAIGPIRHGCNYVGGNKESRLMTSPCQRFWSGSGWRAILPRRRRTMRRDESDGDRRLAARRKVLSYIC